MEIKNFVRERSRSFNQNGDQSAVTAFYLVLLKLEDGGLSAFSRQTQQPILMYLPTVFEGDPDGPDLLKPFDMGENISCARSTWRQPQPSEQTVGAAIP